MIRPVNCKKTSSRLGCLTWIDWMRPLNSTTKCGTSSAPCASPEVELRANPLNRDPVTRLDVPLQGRVTGDDDRVAADAALSGAGVSRAWILP